MPVSVVAMFSKVVERIMYGISFTFLNAFKLQCTYQFGFIEQHCSLTSVSRRNTQGF